MYAVVGCTECGSYWLLSNPAESESATCPRCGRRHQTAKLKRFFESERREEAQQARSALLAKKQGDSEAFAEVDHVADLERAVEDSGVSDREFLTAAGLDADTVEDAGDVSTTRSRGRDEIVRDAVRELERPTAADVLEYAEEHGVPRDAAADLLDRLRDRGEVTEAGGRLRLL